MRNHTSLTKDMHVRPACELALEAAYLKVFANANATRTYNGYDVPIVGPQERFAGEILLTMARAEM